jgi:hypothetical protein
LQRMGLVKNPDFNLNLATVTIGLPDNGRGDADKN